MAFVVPNESAKQVIKAGPQGASEVKKAICRAGITFSPPFLGSNSAPFSTSRTPRLHTSTSWGEWSLWTPFRRTQAGSF